MIHREPQHLLVRHQKRFKQLLFGKFRGKVAEVGTGDDLGFIRAIVPSVYGAKAKSPWATPSVPFAGDQHGWLMLPKEGDGVWIEFEGGHRDLPIWSGFWWAKKDGLPKDASAERRVIASPKGHQIVLDDEQGQVILKHGDGPSITLEKSKIRIELDGQKTIVIDANGVHINGTAFEVG
jgi:uncharacterized protein involved in type VI secretion and phage assembly